MVILEPVRARVEPLPRLWLIFFSDGVAPSRWSLHLRRGFRHVAAAAWYADQQRWVYVNPSRGGTVVEVLRSDEFGPRFQSLLAGSSAILRIRSMHSRRSTPAAFHCVGAIKALLGIRSGALSPHGLYRHLLRAGAQEIDCSGRPFQLTGAAEGGPCGGAGTAAPAAAG